MKISLYPLMGMLILCLICHTACADVLAVPGDIDGDKIVTDEEMETAQENFQEGKITSDVLEAITQIHENYPKTITDTSGKEVTIYKPLENIVVFNSETVETMRSLKSQYKIIGISKYTVDDSVFFPEISKLPSVGSVWSPDIEAVLELRPDAVFLYGTFMESQVDEIQQTLENADPNLVVVRVDCFKPESYIDEVQKLGVILQKEAEAQEYLEFYNDCTSQVESVVSEISEEEKPLVYLESWTDYRTATQGAAWHDKIELAGGNNAFGDLAVSYTEVDSESVIVKNPDLVIKLCGAGGLTFGGYSEDDGTSEMEDLQKLIIDRPGWESISAVTDGQVYVLSNDILGGAQHFIGVTYLTKLFSPEKAQNLDPRAIHEEYLTRFQGMEMKDYWTFAYPDI